MFTSIKVPYIFSDMADLCRKRSSHFLASQPRQQRKAKCCRPSGKTCYFTQASAFSMGRVLSSQKFAPASGSRGMTFDERSMPQCL